MSTATSRTRAARDRDDELALEIDRQAATADVAQRTPTALTIIAISLCALPLLCALPGVRGLLGVGVLEMTVFSVAMAVAIASATLAHRLGGGASRVYRCAHVVEGIAIQVGVMTLVYRSGHSDSFFWLLYFVHLAASTWLLARSWIVVMPLGPVCLAVIYLWQDQPGLAGVAIMCGLLGVMVRRIAMQNRRTLAAATLDRHRIIGELADLRRENERLTVARDLHDTVGADLSALLWRIEAMRLTSREDGALHDALGQLADRARTAIEVLRSVVVMVREPALSLGQLVDRLRDRGHDLCPPAIGLEVECSGDIRATIPGATGGLVLRAAEEAVRNAIQHASPSRITMRIACGGDGSLRELAISDDGRGFSLSERPRPGRGLDNLDARARALGGQLAIESSQQGTCIRITVPAGA